MELNYEKDMYIDESQLEQEWLNQAALAIKYGKYFAECKKVVTLAEEKVKLVRSELTSKIIADPRKYVKNLDPGKSPTGPVIEATYRNHKKHIKAKEAWAKAMYELDLAEIAYKEISFTRKTALENLVKLHGQNYFAGPKVPRDISAERLKIAKTKDTNKKVGKRRRKTS